MCTTPTHFIYLPFKTPSVYTYVCQLRVMSDLADLKNHQHTICINSLLSGFLPLFAANAAACGGHPFDENGGNFNCLWLAAGRNSAKVNHLLLFPC